jgi:hypothetical protein
MTNTIVAIKSGLIAAASLGAGQLLENHDISLPTLCSVFAIVAPATWWISARMTRQDDAIDKLGESIKRIEKTLAIMPCQKPRCPTEKD